MNRCIYCIQISHQRYISAVIHTALLNNVRKVGRLVLSRSYCFTSGRKINSRGFLSRETVTLQGRMKRFESLIEDESP
jgi:hypothetical protein